MLQQHCSDPLVQTHANNLTNHAVLFLNSWNGGNKTKSKFTLQTTRQIREKMWPKKQLNGEDTIATVHLYLMSTWLLQIPLNPHLLD